MSEQFLQQILGELKSINNRLDNLEKGQADLKIDVSTLKDDVGTLKTDVSDLKTDVSTLKTDVNTLKTDVSDLKVITKRLEERQEMIYKEVGGLLEFRAGVNEKFDKLTETIDYLKHKGSETEQQLFIIKRKLPQST
ncbi:MAG: hypothetical protein ACOYVD_13560 [Bacillota bacterium]